MPSISGAVDQATKLLKDRISELENELSKLQTALSNLTDTAAGRRRGPGRPRGSRTAARRASAGTATRRRGRKRTTRADQAVRLIKGNPGITASEIAKRMRIQPNYLYRVLGDLQKQGKVKKSGRSYTAA